MTTGLHAVDTRFRRFSRWLGLYLLAPLLLVLAIPVVLQLPQEADFGFSPRHLAVVSVTPGGPAAAAGIAAGDRVVAVDGNPVRTMSEYFAAIAGNFDLVPVTLALQRGEAVVTAVVEPVRYAPRDRIVSYSQWLTGFGFLLIGWYVYFQRPDTVTRNFFGVCLLFAFFLMDIPDLPSVTYISGKELVRALLQLLLPVYFLRFLLYFPSQTAPHRRQIFRGRLLFAPVLPLFLPSAYAEINKLDPGQSVLLTTTEMITSLYVAAYFLAGLAIFARKTLRRDRPIQRNKLRVVLLGMIVGLVPFTASALLGSLVPGSSLDLLRWLGLSVVLVPLTFGLAILRYGALDTSFVLRCGLNYGVLTVGLLAAYGLLVGLLGHLLTRIFGVSSYPLAMLVMAGSAFVILPMRRSLQHWIERTFYPSLRADRNAIEALGRELSGLIDGRNTTLTLLSRLAALYKPTTLSLFLADQDKATILRERMRVHDGRRARPRGGLTEDTALAEFLNQMRRPVFAEEFTDLGLQRLHDKASTDFLTGRKVDLLVPLIVRNRLSGFLTFGPKTQGGLYTQADLANLRGLAIQAAALLESRRLYEKVLARKQMETELALASDIQTRLLPTEAWDDGAVQICGRMDPCREVGGDYFDYFRLDDDTVGLAIADVSGKGIPAALLMADLRASLRTAAIEQRRPEAVVRRLNATCGALTPIDKFISFFYAVYSRADRMITYCNAGMDPPLLFRHDRPFHETLRKGGPVLGAIDDHLYRSGVVTMRPGDLLVHYTDGLTEQLNEDEEFFELERLIKTILATRTLSLEEVQKRVFAAVTEFGGSRRTDDRTLMLMRAAAG